MAIAAWSARPWRRSSSSAAKRAWLRGRDRERADDLAARGAQRCGRHPAQPEPLRHLVVVALVRDARVGGVVLGPDRHAGLGGQAVDPATEPEAHAEQPALGLGVGRAGDDHRHEIGPVLGETGEVRAVGPEQTAGLLDDPVEDDVGLAQRCDPGGDVTQRPLGVRPPGDGRLGVLEGLDQPGVGDGDGRLVGQATEDGGVDVVERVAITAVDLDRPERPVVADDRSDDEVADTGRPGHLVGVLEVLELSLEVVTRGDDPALGHGLARQALTDPKARGADGRPLLVGQAGVVCVCRGRLRRGRTRRSQRHRPAAAGAPRRRSAGAGRPARGWR